MQFVVRFDVTQPDTVSNEDLVAIWRREATAALGAMDAVAVTLPIYEYTTFAGDLDEGVHGG